MDEFELELTSWTWWQFLITFTGFIVFIWFLWISRNQETNYEESFSITTCQSPNCARCQGLDIANLTQRLKQRLEAFFESLPETAASLEMKARMQSLVFESINHKSDIISTVYEESGYNLLGGHGEDLLPHIWMLPGLNRHTFWSGHVDERLHEVTSILQDPRSLQSIQDDFRRVYQDEKGWKINSIPSGRWRVYHLYNQGERVDENAAKCPFTAELLLTVPSFMLNHVFGNAMFSVLEPGSSIEPHTGPCNYRLRCHLPLVTPPGYKLKVGRDVSLWVEGKLMIFDDSFVHEVWHEPEGSDCSERVVFILDIWHPQVTTDEQTALHCIYD